MKKKDEKTNENVTLISVSNNMEAESIIEILHNQGIPVFKKFKGSGEYLNIMMGQSPFGIELMVPIGLYEKARASIEGIYSLNCKDYDERDEKNPMAYKGMKIIVGLFLLLFMVISLLSLLLVFL